MAVQTERRGYGDLAQAILDLVSQAGSPVTPAQVRDSLGGDLAYTTVMTVMARLHDRGLLARQRAGRAFAYTAVGDPTQVTARRMHRLLDVEENRAGVLARLGQVLAGSLVAGIGAYLSLRFLTRYFETRTLTPFAIYCAIAGLASLAWFAVAG